MVALENSDVPVAGRHLHGVRSVADVCTGVPTVGEGEAAQLVDVIFERVEHPPLLWFQAGDEFAIGGSISTDERRVDTPRQCGDAPASHRGGRTRGDPT